MTMRILILLLLSLIPYWAIAQDAVDRLVLKDGTQYEGYIKIQHIGKDLVFVSQKKTAIITGATISQPKKFDIDKLPEPWKKWANEHKNLINKKEKYFNLSDIFFNMAKGEDLKDVYVLEEGDEIKYIDLKERTETIPLTEIQSVERIPAPDSIISKTIDVITKKVGDEKIEGYIICQIPGDIVKIKQESGVIKVIKFSNILSEEKKKVCSDLSFWAQSKYLEIVRTKGKEYEGVITMRYYGTDSEEGYLLVTDREGESHKVLMKDVTEIQKTPNKGYKERILLEVEDDRVYINRNLAEWHQTEKSSKKYMLRADEGMTIIQLAEDIQDMDVDVEMQNTDENRATFLLKAKRQSKDSPLYFTHDSIVDDAITPQKESVSTNGILSRIYALDRGEYVLFRRSDRKCVLLKIK